MRLYSLVLIGLLFTGCDTKDIAKAELERQIEALTKENKDLKQELENYKNRFEKTSNKMFK